MTINENEQQYLNLAQYVLDHGHTKSDRTGTATRPALGNQMRLKHEEGFPLLTTKKVPFGLIKSELLWFLRGDSNIQFLLKHKNHIWDEWAFKKWVESDEYHGPDMTDFGHRWLQDPEFKKAYLKEKRDFCDRIVNDDDFAKKYGDLGLVYGSQWRHWKTSNGQTIDQIANVIHQIKTTPDSRRMIVSAWNPEDVPSMAQIGWRHYQMVQFLPKWKNRLSPVYRRRFRQSATVGHHRIHCRYQNFLFSSEADIGGKHCHR